MGTPGRTATPKGEASALQRSHYNYISFFDTTMGYQAPLLRVVGRHNYVRHFLRASRPPTQCPAASGQERTAPQCGPVVQKTSRRPLQLRERRWQ